MNEDEMDKLVREGSPPPKFPTSFQRDVWQRIAVSEQRSLRGWISRFVSEALQSLTQPAAAVATVVAMLLIGAGLGGLTSPQGAREADLRAAYAASINPITSAHAAQAK